MTKIRALITLVVGKGQELPPGGLYDLSDDEAKRLASLNFAEIISKNQNQHNNAKAKTKTGADTAKPNENGSGQPVQSAGTTGQVSK